ncbi:MAG TPA: YaaL family protein [Candidatus Eubacterium avistercoris]|uniref:YaaL family protein n=1 Tax=Candidatus Eubacterium avistercoris TaxID=2838567 RepID=A0A9D2D5H8_9FIRM|nr:YaaL family protein [Candidatus Eubacterium avistercoris]
MKRSRQELSKNSDSSLLLRDIQKVKSELDCAYSNFENAVEPDLIDCYIYQLKSAQMRYKFLLNRAKQAELQEKRRDVAHN